MIERIVAAFSGTIIDIFLVEKSQEICIPFVDFFSSIKE